MKYNYANDTKPIIFVAAHFLGGNEPSMLHVYTTGFVLVLPDTVLCHVSIGYDYGHNYCLLR